MATRADSEFRENNRFQVQGIPALLLFRSGREVDRIIGAQPKSTIASRIQDALAGA